ncbi:hypothetical protein [Methylophilus aquaticus]|uniref:Uncharacterized protein n=1 Tax=Methylophilus aquaticus TaxID=1971610 RepID=A0ABT9JUH8_9PROT|nr:hypothetical protein [Methylophilus aquaticus]MDP8568189.1 hypothetical protein [Methylophilus aquaticus]
MSPLWPSTIRVLVLADRILAEYLSGGPRPHRQVVQQAFSGTEPQYFQVAMLSLLSQLPASRWQRIAVYLADRHVHMMVLPEPPMALSAADKEAYALAMLAQTYGEEARQWPFRMQDHRLPSPALLTAIPLLGQHTRSAAQAMTLFGQPRWLQHTIQPYVGALLTHSRLPEEGSVVIAEQGLVRLLHVKHRRVLHAAHWSGDVQDSASIADWLMRERTLLASEDSPCCWLAETTHRRAQQAGQALSTRLQGIQRLQWLSPVRAVTGLWQEVAHVA